MNVRPVKFKVKTATNGRTVLIPKRRRAKDWRDRGYSNGIKERDTGRPRKVS